MYGMMKQKLEARAEQGKPIQAGFVGAGRMGTGGMCQIGAMRGIRTSVIADLNTDRAARAFELCGHKREDIVFTGKTGAAEDALRKGRPVVTEDAELVSAVGVDVVVDATGVPEVGARVATQTIKAGKHIVMLNVETDGVVGPILYDMAKKAGVVYTVVSGDEPGLVAEYYDRYTSLGFEIVAVGKAPSSLAHFNRYATPDSVAEDARRLGINPHFLVTFRDGTKTMIEMACISNYTRLVPDIPGMHGPVAGVDEMVRLFRPKSEGGLLNRRGVVDYARPIMTEAGKIDFHRSVTPGVFLVVYTDHPQIRADLDYLDVTGADGYYNMYTPYHLVTNEMPLAIVTAVLDHHPTVYAKYGLVTEVVGVAKRDLKPGDIIDGLGGAMLYSSNDLYESAKAQNQVPMGLLPGAKVLRAIPKDQVITREAVEIKTDTTLYRLRALQDRGGSAAPAELEPQVGRGKGGRGKGGRMDIAAQ